MVFVCGLSSHVVPQHLQCQFQLELSHYCVNDIVLRIYLVNETPLPVFTRFVRFYYWMISLFEMLCTVLVRRGIATSHMTASQAQSQMHPAGAYLFAFFASLGVAFDSWINFAHMCALSRRFAFHVIIRDACIIKGYAKKRSLFVDLKNLGYSYVKIVNRASRSWSAYSLEKSTVF